MSDDYGIWVKSPTTTTLQNGKEVLAKAKDIDTLIAMLDGVMHVCPETLTITILDKKALEGFKPTD